MSGNSYDPSINKRKDLSENINDLWDKVLDISDNVTEIKISNNLQGSTISESETLSGDQTAQIEANTAAITTLKTQTKANTTATATAGEYLQGIRRY